MNCTFSQKSRSIFLIKTVADINLDKPTDHINKQGGRVPQVSSFPIPSRKSNIILYARINKQQQQQQQQQKQQHNNNHNHNHNNHNHNHNHNNHNNNY